MDDLQKDNSELELEDILKEFGDLPDEPYEDEDVLLWGEEPVDGMLFIHIQDMKIK